MITKHIYTVTCPIMLREALKLAPGSFVPTGSRVYGGLTHMSDYDFIVNPESTWHRGEWFQQLLLLSNSGYAPVVKRTPYAVCEEDQTYNPGVAVAPEGMDRDVVYVVNPSGDEQINFIFPSSKKEFEAWCKTTETLKEAKGALKRLISENKSCRLAAFKAAFAVHMAAK